MLFPKLHSSVLWEEVLCLSLVFLSRFQAGLTPPAISQMGRKHSRGESTGLCVSGTLLLSSQP